MKKEIRKKSYVVPVQPIPWQRPGLHGKQFFDRQALEKHNFGLYLINQHNNEPLFDGPLEMEFIFNFQIPAKKVRHFPYPCHTVRPDLDNLVGFCLDAMNRVIITDDKNVIAYKAQKLYTSEPSVHITIVKL